MRTFLSNVGRGNRTVGARPVHCTILDLGTEQIKALVLEWNRDEAFVMGVGKARHPGGWGPNDAPVDISAMARSCDQALREAEDMTGQISNTKIIPDWVVVGLPSSLTVANIFSVTHHRPHAAKQISDKELRAVAVRAQRSALNQFARRVGAVQSPQRPEVELLETTIADIRVDDHSVTNPIGFRGEALSVAVLNIVVSFSHARAIEAITQHLGLEVLMVVSGWQALASMLHERQGMCIDVGGRATDIVSVRNGKVCTTASISMGGGDFTKHLAQAFDISWKDAETLKLAYSRGMMEDVSEEHVSQALEPVMNVWLAELERALNSLTKSHDLPHLINLCGGGSSLPDILEAMRSHPWAKVLDFPRHPQVRLMQPEEVSCVLDRTGQLEGQQDVSTLALARHTMTGNVKSDSIRTLLWRVKRPAMFGNKRGTG